MVIFPLIFPDAAFAADFDDGDDDKVIFSWSFCTVPHAIFTFSWTDAFLPHTVFFS